MLLSRASCTTQASGDLLTTVGSSCFMRGNGGFGGRSDGAPKPHPVPADRAPDLMLDLPTRPEQAAALSLERRPTTRCTSTPRWRAAAGFDKPILHGLCSYGIAGRAVLKLAVRQRPGAPDAARRALRQPGVPGRNDPHRALARGAGARGVSRARARARRADHQQRPGRVHRRLITPSRRHSMGLLDAQGRDHHRRRRRPRPRLRTAARQRRRGDRRQRLERRRRPRRSSPRSRPTAAGPWPRRRRQRSGRAARRSWRPRSAPSAASTSSSTTPASCATRASRT